MLDVCNNFYMTIYISFSKYHKIFTKMDIKFRSVYWIYPVTTFNVWSECMQYIQWLISALIGYESSKSWKFAVISCENWMNLKTKIFLSLVFDLIPTKPSIVSLMLCWKPWIAWITVMIINFSLILFFCWCLYRKSF